MSESSPQSGVRRGLKRNHGLTVGVLACIVAAACYSLSAQARKPTEFEVKAAYLFQFGKFVKWPASAPPVNNTFPICVAGNDSFGSLVDSIVAGESLDGRRLSVQRVSN